MKNAHATDVIPRAASAGDRRGRDEWTSDILAMRCPIERTSSDQAPGPVAPRMTAPGVAPLIAAAVPWILTAFPPWPAAVA